MKHFHMINIETNTGIVRIELLDNPFVNDWKEHFITMLNNTEYSYHYITHPYLESNYMVKGNLSNRVNLLKDVIDELNTFVTFPVSTAMIDNKHTDTPLNFMQLLNEIHRYSTTAVRVMRLNKSDGNTIELYWTDDDPYNSKFNVDYNDVEKFALLMDKANLGVHHVESAIPTPRKLALPRIETVEVSFDYTEPEILDLTEDKKVFYKHTIKHEEYMSDSDNYDVWMAWDILGKNYQEAYFDHDDPTEWDITHPMGHSGGFQVSLSEHTLQSLIKSNDMQNWFKEYNLSYNRMMNNFPLGNVIEGKEHLNNMEECTISYG